jgi:predicted nucleic acid-binding protein
MYLDTSVLAKLFVQEPDSESCAARVRGETLVSSELSHAEFFSMLLRKERSGEISLEKRQAACAEFGRQLAMGDIHLTPLDSSIVRKARDLMAEVHPYVALRTLDALHLATYLDIFAAPLFTNDRNMREAAKLLEIALA